jgi:hypothetical protein
VGGDQVHRRDVVEDRLPEVEAEAQPGPARLDPEPAVHGLAGEVAGAVDAELFLAPKTVEFRLRQIYRKLGARSRAQLTATLARQAPPDPTAAPEP